jgi:hypothetical protein
MNSLATKFLPILFMLSAVAAFAQLPVVPPEKRGRVDAERRGTHDANNIRTEFWNYGMVGNYPPDPGNVDLSVFHSVEVPRGGGMNYSDGVTPFVLAKIRQRNGAEAFIMETGFRERQAESPFKNRVMRFEPRPGYFQADPNINRAVRPPSATIRALGRSRGRIRKMISTIPAGAAVGTAISANVPTPIRKASR